MKVHNPEIRHKELKKVELKKNLLHVGFELVVGVFRQDREEINEILDINSLCATKKNKEPEIR